MVPVPRFNLVQIPEMLGLDLDMPEAPEGDFLEDPVLTGRGNTVVGVHLALTHHHQLQNKLQLFAHIFEQL